MFEFRKLCKAVEQMDPETYGSVMAAKSKNVLAALSQITGSADDAVSVYLNFILCTIACDGKLDESEYQILRPALEAASGREVTYETAVKVFEMAGLDRPKEYRMVVDRMADMLGAVSVDLKYDIVTVCLLVCAVDGRISGKEKKWIKQLLR